MSAVASTHKEHASAITKAVIDLNACRHNLSVAQAAAPKSKCIAVIKANAYGHGMLNIAKALTTADAFAIARVGEAVQLRDAGITQPILVLEGFNSVSDLQLVQRYNLESVVHNEHQLNLLEQNESISINISVKIDSGMHRLGFNSSDVEKVINRLQQCKSIQHPFKLMTHLANADDRQDDFSLKQINVFIQSAKDYLKDNKVEVSIANSAGILAWPQSHSAIACTTWNRPGIMLYGVSPFIDSQASVHDLKPVMTLSSKLIAVKKVSKGEAIGYSGTYICEEDKTIGIVAIGYGDGYPRHAKTGTPVLVNGKRCALLGRVSMDMICVDLTEQPNAQVNDSVVLWGEGLAVEEIAECAETIAYDLLCGVTQRVQFNYIAD